MDFQQQMQHWCDMVNNALKTMLQSNESKSGESATYETIFSAMEYSLLAGGKRIRPVLALAVNEMLGGREEDILPLACAIEMIHTYSLIHDDLPAMDNDDYRRGRQTNHKVFGEGIAVLAGDALLNTAFERMFEEVLSHPQKAELYTRAAYEIAKAAGVNGMIGGQVIDLESENKKISGELLNMMYRLKTGALIKAPVRVACILNNTSPSQMHDIDTFAENLGLAFQIRDDILDVEGNLKKMGKKSGSDRENSKSTYVSLYGINSAKKMLEEISSNALNALEKFGEKAWFLKDLTRYLLIRDH